MLSEMQSLSEAEKLIRYGSTRKLMSDFNSIDEILHWLFECGIILSDGRITSLTQAFKSIEYQARHPDIFTDRKDYSLVIGHKKGHHPRFYMYKTNDSATGKAHVR